MFWFPAALVWTTELDLMPAFPLKCNLHLWKSPLARYSNQGPVICVPFWNLLSNDDSLASSFWGKSQVPVVFSLPGRPSSIRISSQVLLVLPWEAVDFLQLCTSVCRRPVFQVSTRALIVSCVVGLSALSGQCLVFLLPAFSPSVLPVFLCFLSFPSPFLLEFSGHEC